LFVLNQHLVKTFAESPVYRMQKEKERYSTELMTLLVEETMSALRQLDHKKKDAPVGFRHQGWGGNEKVT